MDSLITIAVSVAAGFYVLSPLWIWITGMRLLPAEWETLNPNAAVPAHVEAHFRKMAAFLANNGFNRAGDRVYETIRSGWCTYVELWRNSRTGESVYVATAQKGDADAFCKHFAVFLHENEKGALIATSNFAGMMRSNFSPAGESRLNAPSLDMITLRALHQGHIATFERPSRPIRARDGLTLCQALDASMRAAALSQKRFRASGDSLRITIRGAFYAVWINLPPLRSMHARLNRRKCNMARAAVARVMRPAENAA